MKIKTRYSAVERRPLYGHQQVGLEYMLQRQHSALFMEMRLGKTLLTIRYVQAVDRAKNAKCLVLSPSAVLETWDRELSLEGEKSYLGLGLSSSQRIQQILDCWDEPGRAWVLLTYEGLRAMSPGKGEAPQIPCALPWFLVALDECTKVRNPQALITRICTSGFRQAEHRAILSGRPRPESDLDIFCPMQFLYNTFMGKRNWWSYRDTFFKPSETGDWFPKEGKGKEIKDILHRRAFILTRKDANIDTKKIYEQRFVSMNKAQERLYSEIEKDFRATLEGNSEAGNGGGDEGTERLSTNNVLTQMLWLSRVSGGFDPRGELISTNKAMALLEILEGDLQGEKVVIWTRFRAENQLVAETLAGAGIRAAQITGDTSPGDRINAIRQFREDPTTKGLVAQVQTAKFGLDLSVASCAIYYSNDWSGEARDQSEDRIVHPAKRELVLLVDLVSRNSMDPILLEALKDKNLNSRLFMLRMEKLLFPGRNYEGARRS